MSVLSGFGAARIGEFAPLGVAGGSSRSGGERLAAYDCRPPVRVVSSGQTVTDSHTPGLPATSARNETRGFAPRYHNATHIWASTTTTGTLLLNRVVAVNVDQFRHTECGHPSPRPAPAPWWRADYFPIEPVCGGCKAAYIFLYECRSEAMTAILLVLVGLAFVAGLVAVMIRLERSQRRLIERRREGWEAEGRVGAHPDDFIGRGYSGGNFG
jgi:hypothetical protein